MLCLFPPKFGWPSLRAEEWDRASGAPRSARGSSLFRAAGPTALMEWCIFVFVSSSFSDFVSCGRRWCPAQSVRNPASEFVGFSSSSRCQTQNADGLGNYSILLLDCWRLIKCLHSSSSFYPQESCVLKPVWLLFRPGTQCESQKWGALI